MGAGRDQTESVWTMVQSWVDFKWEGRLPEVPSNKELRSYLYFSKANLVALLKRPTEGKHGRQETGDGDKQAGGSRLGRGQSRSR